MVDVDVVYSCRRDDAWKCIKRYIRNPSINMAIFDATNNSYINKKIIWNAIGRLLPDGIFCIICEFENISDIIRILDDQDMFYNTTCFHCKGIVYVTIFASKKILFLPKVSSSVVVSSLDDYIYQIVGLGSFGDIVLVINNFSLRFCEIAKNLGRYIIAIGDSKILIKKAHEQGIRKVVFDG